MSKQDLSNNPLFAVQVTFDPIFNDNGDPLHTVEQFEIVRPNGDVLVSMHVQSPGDWLWECQLGMQVLCDYLFKVSRPCTIEINPRRNRF